MKLAGHLPAVALTEASIRSEKGGRLLALLRERLAARGICSSMVVPADSDPAIEAGAAACWFSRSDLVFSTHPGLECPAMLELDGGRPLPEFGGERFACLRSSEVERCADSLQQWVFRCWRSTPLKGCVLIGGVSSRMGHPKHLLRDATGVTWLERAVRLLQSEVGMAVIGGGGELPPEAGDWEQLPDLPGARGPIAGLAAFFQHYPQESAVLLACDLPQATPAAIQWLLAQRQPGVRAVIPRHPLTGKSEPLLAWYDFRIAPSLRQQIASGRLGLHHLRRETGVVQPRIPLALVSAWRNVNTPEDLEQLPGQMAKRIRQPD